MPEAERCSIENGIHACQSCGKLIDSDTCEYTADQLRTLKADAEHRAKLRQQGRDVDADDRRVEERKRWLRKFEGLTYEFGGATIQLVWAGPLDDLRTIGPRDVDSDELRVVHCALCRYAARHLQPTWQRISGSGQLEVWEVDSEWTSKHLLRSLRLKDEYASLRVRDRREPCQVFCGRCGRTWMSANFCPDCAQELREPEFRVTHCT